MDETELLKELAHIIFLYRKKKKITLDSLSEKVGKSKKYLSELELGKNNPKIIDYLKIAKELEIPIAEIEKILSEFFRTNYLLKA